MSGQKTAIRGFKLDKHGKLVRDAGRLNVSKRLQRKGAQKVSYGKGKR